MSQAGTILDRILDTKREEISLLATRTSVREFAAQCADLPPTRGFEARVSEAGVRGPGSGIRQEASGIEHRALGGESISPQHSTSTRTPDPGPRTPAPPIPSLIAEVKKASPSKGIIRADFDPVAIAKAYYAGGASCLSVLTDESYFQGSLSYLAAIREAVPLPLLRKDFIISPIQIYEARLAGADAILLIVSAIPNAPQLREFRGLAASLGLDTLVEIHDQEELEIAVASGATLIGVNNRNLKTFEMRLETAETLIPQFPAGTTAVAESGIFTFDHVQRMARAGAKAILVGESLMREPDVTVATKRLLGSVS